MRPLLPRLAFPLVALLGCGSPVPAGPRALALTNGHWFTGERFESRTMYVVGDTLRVGRPPRLDSTVDLAGGFVVPPFAEGHNHWLEPVLVPVYNEHYLQDGVFYLDDMGNGVALRRKLDSSLNRPGTVDFKSANQGWTGPGGHPLEVVSQLSQLGAFPMPGNEAERDDFVFVVTTEAEIDQKWPRFIAGHPDYLKLFLIYSDEYRQRLHDDRVGKHRGLNPALVPGLVRRARAAHLPVLAHVANAADFRVATAAGVDRIVHLPFYDAKRGVGISLLTEKDAREAAVRQIVVVPTIAWIGVEIEDSAGQNKLLRELVVPNLTVLKRAGVTLLVGSDQFRRTPVIEADWLAKSGVFANAELLRMWSETTPRAMFPGRRIGRLDDGFEASLLVLDADPLADFSATRRIRYWMKQGVWLHPNAAAKPFPPLPGS